MLLGITLGQWNHGHHLSVLSDSYTRIIYYTYIFLLSYFNSYEGLPFGYLTYSVYNFQS